MARITQQSSIHTTGTSYENEPIIKSDGASSNVMQWLSNNEASNITISEDGSNNLDLVVSAGNVGIGGTATDKLTLVDGQMRLTDSYGIRWGTNAAGIYGSAAGYGLKLYTAGVERMNINNAGLSSFSAGIAFSGQTDAAGMTATTLNHYETGTWTPVHNATWSTQPVVGSGTTPVFSGTYTRVGNIVHATVILDFDDTASIAVDDRWTISGLPFTPAATDFTGSNSFFIYASLGSGNNAMGVVGASGTSGDRCLFYVINVDGALTYATVLRAEFTYKV